MIVSSLSVNSLLGDSNNTDDTNSTIISNLTESIMNSTQSDQGDLEKVMNEHLI